MTIIEGQHNLGPSPCQRMDNASVEVDSCDEERMVFVRRCHLERAEDAVYAGFRFVAELAVDREHGHVA